MIQRRIQTVIDERLDDFPAVVLTGPRQSGKTTIAREIGVPRDAFYLDLESERDRARLDDPERYLSEHLDRLIILDEIHRFPGLFPSLRGLIDTARRMGKGKGRYLLLGSATIDLLRQSGESLAGRVSYIELGPFDISEISHKATDIEKLWLRGGFPESFLAPSGPKSMRWRLDFIRTYLERDIPQFGPRIAADKLRRLWIMLAHQQGSMLNVANLARNLGVDVKTAGGYLDLLVDLLLVRKLPPWHANVGKRLVKSPKVYVRDSGVAHALLAVESRESLLDHPVLGPSWEGFVIEQILAVAPDGVEGYYYRTSAGAEIDLLLLFPDGTLWAVDIKRSSAPRPERGFHAACVDLKPKRKLVVYPGDEAFPSSGGTDVVPLVKMAELFRKK